MSNVQDLTVQFYYDDNTERQFYMPGDLMRGVITVYLRGPITVRTIELFVSGIGAVSWEIPGKKKLYSSKETYLEGGKKVVEEHNGRALSLGRGAHEYPFQYQLPTDIPSSFNGVYGNITYLTKVSLECEDERHNLIVSEPFLFLRRPYLPAESSSDKDMSTSRSYFGFCTSGKVKVQCSLTRTGGVPGEDISINADVMNWSPREILVIQASIILDSVYYARGKKIAFRQIINKREDPYDFDNRKGRRWRNVLMAMPPYIAETNLKFCNIMDVSYTFQFRVAVSGTEDIQLECPIFVGGHPEGYDPRGGNSALTPSNVVTREMFPWHTGQSTVTESVDGDAFYGYR
ncbi:hypothetical protein SNE40_015329 [Patella caerulea]|uniref:Arrestin C-terminal-like domain-containing protein n=1 Tax=Patella caerulea TaxID=87958 RepID=A0AAN8JN79_PATCE